MTASQTLDRWLTAQVD